MEVFEYWESDLDVLKYMFWIDHNDINKSINWIKREVIYDGKEYILKL